MLDQPRAALLRSTVQASTDASSSLPRSVAEGGSSEWASRRPLCIFMPPNAAGAAKIGKTLRPTEVLIFGNPQGGTPFMECAQSVGIDLPLKALVWEDSSGQVWLGYNHAAYLAKRHEVSQCAVAANIAKALAGLAEATVSP